MANILVAWELGEALGHFARCLHLAHGLVQRGHAVTLALKDVRLPPSGPLPGGAVLVQAPAAAPSRPSRPPVNYADLLLTCGFGHVADLAARLQAWQGLFTLARPTVVVADHAPTALLAARLADIPALAIGNGFVIPPAATPWPSIRPWENIPEAALRDAERHLDERTAQAQRLLGRQPPVHMRELFGQAELLDTFPELDHYGTRDSSHYIGPIVALAQTNRVAWQATGGRKVLAYLRPRMPGFADLMAALGHLDAEVLCVAPGLPVAHARRLATRRLRIALAAVDLPPLLAEADLAFGYGNSGFSTQALLAGVPVLMRPIHVEQAMFARRVEALGAGQVLESRAGTSAVESIRSALCDTTRRQAAQAFRERHRGFSSARASTDALDAIERGTHGTRAPTRRDAAQDSIPWLH